MSNSYFQYIEDLARRLAANSFNAVEIVRDSHADLPLMLENPLPILVEAYVYRGGRSRVEIHSDAHSVRILGLILISRAVLAPVVAMSIKLDVESEINLLYLDPIKGQLDFYECVPTVLEYKFCAEMDEYSREGRVVEDRYRPGFHYLSKQDKGERLTREIPEWVESALVIEGTANSALRLGAMLLDLTHPSRPGGGLMHLQRRFDQVCAMTYSIDWELRLID